MTNNGAKKYCNYFLFKNDSDFNVQTKETNVKCNFGNVLSLFITFV